MPAARAASSAATSVASPIPLRLCDVTTPIPPIQPSVPRRATSATPTGSPPSTATRERPRSTSIVSAISAKAAASNAIGNQ